MAAYEAYSAVFFNHFIINGLQKSLFWRAKQGFLEAKRVVFAMQKRNYCFSLKLCLQNRYIGIIE